MKSKQLNEGLDKFFENPFRLVYGKSSSMKRVQFLDVYRIYFSLLSRLEQYVSKYWRNCGSSIEWKNVKEEARVSWGFMVVWNQVNNSE